MQAILFDLDGVFYVGERPLPGAAAVMDWVREAGIPHAFVTNTSSRPRQALVEKLARFGLEVGAGEIFTPARAARDWLQAEGRVPVALFVPEATRADFDGLAVADRGEARALVVGDLGEGWDFATLNRAFRLLMAGPDVALVALGMTRYWQAPDGLRLDVGPFVSALAYAAEREPVVCGKPSAAFFHAACAALGVPPAECLMIGDDIRGDIAGAQSAGLRAALVRTGKFRPSDLEGDVRPDAVLDSIADLPARWPLPAG